MKQRLICKTLAVTVIILFLGLAIQPSVAVQPNTSESDDCNICPAVSVISKLVDEEDNQELSDMVNEFVDIYYNVQPKTLDDRIKPICVILLIPIGLNLFKSLILWKILWFLQDNMPLLLELYLPIFKFIAFEIVGPRIVILFDFAKDIGCDYAQFPYPQLLDRK